MKFMKAVALICAVSLGVSSLAGYQKVSSASSAAAQNQASAAEPQNQELNIAVFEGGYGREVWDDLAKQFEAKNPGVKINVTANAKLGDVIRPQIMNGNPPDFIFLSSTNESGILQSLIQDKKLEDISDVFTGDLKDKMIDGTLSAPTISPYGDGKIYAAPLSYSTMGLFYNKTLFKENNWEVPTTWDEFFALGEKAKAKGIALFTYAAANDPSYNEIVVNPTIAVAGGEQALQDCLNYKKGAWKSDAVKKTFNIYQKIKDGGYLLNGTLAMTHTQSQQQFLQNKCLFIPNGNWLETEMKDAPKAKGFEYGFAGLPTFNKTDKKYIWANCEEMYIPKDAKNIPLAKKFLAFLYEDASIQTLAGKAGIIPPIKGAANLVKNSIDQSVYDTFTITDKGYIPVTGSYALTSQTEVNLRDDLYQDLNQIMAGTLTTDKWSENLEKDAGTLSSLILK